MKLPSVNRRGFLGMFGVAAVSGPKAIAKAAPVTDMQSVLSATRLAGADGYDGIEHEVSSDTQWAKDSLKKLLKRSIQDDERQIRQMRIYDFDPDVAGLVSMSVSSKVRISRRRQYFRKKERDREYLGGVIKGWW